MAKQESDREDLMREATALVRRAELVMEKSDELDPVVVGFRRDGRFSVYFGADPVYQFDHQLRLRRAYVDGLLFRTQGATLAELTRVRDGSGTQLLRRDFSPSELEEFRESALRRLADLQGAMASGKVRITGKVPPDWQVFEEVAACLDVILDARLPLAPGIPGKK